uniref:Lysosomal dipeptide transporter MFSD1 n=1 Tax=Tetraodon nigroviridis TaxID=99883 RepID=H3CQI7_TETNG
MLILNKQASMTERRHQLEDEGEASSGGTQTTRKTNKLLLAICDPNHLLHCVVILVFVCFLGHGAFFCFDNPAALQTEFIKDLDLSTAEFMVLYSCYAWPNVVLCFFGGFLIDRVFGIRLGAIIFSLFVCAGQVIFATGALVNRFWLCEVGRFVFGIGGESLAVAQNTYAVNWFKGKELNLVFGLQISIAQLGSTVNMNTMGPIYNSVTDLVGSTGYVTLGISLMIGGLPCLFSLLCALVLGFLDRRAEKILHKEERKKGQRNIILIQQQGLLSCIIFEILIFLLNLHNCTLRCLVFFIEKFNFSLAEARAVNSIVYLISAPASLVLGFLVNKTGRNVIWVLIAVVTTLAAHMMLAFTFWNPWIAMSVLGASCSVVACVLWPMVAFVVPEHQLGTAYGFMQSIQNLGLALIAMAAGTILDTRGYLILEVFFCTCVCSECFCVCVSVLVLLGLWMTSGFFCLSFLDGGGGAVLCGLSQR